MLPTDDSEGSLAGNAGVAGFIGDPVWRVYTEPTRNSYHQYVRSREKEQAKISTKL